MTTSQQSAIDLHSAQFPLKIQPTLGEFWVNGG